MKKIVVIGDYTLDIIIKNVGIENALCRSAMIDIIPGGVGRNVALNLKNLGADVVFLTSYNGSTAGVVLECDSKKNNLTVRNISGERLNIFCAELDNHGQVHRAFYEIAELEKIAPEVLVAEIERVKPDCVALDANLLPKQLSHLCSWCVSNNVEYALEAVSAPKANRILNAIPGCLLVKLNQFELQSMFGEVYSSKSEIEVAAKQLVAMGAHNVIVSLGAQGSIFVNKETEYYYPAGEISVISENGAGDAMFAMALLSILRGAPLDVVARRAIAAAERTCMVDQSVCQDLNMREL
ncbi:MAG: PfkB family carbohydrate kinase [Negativicutes bacterium]